MVGPNEALEWLTKNVKNRRLNLERVKNLAAAMTRDEWRLNGQPVIFDSNGNLQDGQHRLRAIVESGCIVPMIVIRNVVPDAFVTIDTGRSRTTADVLGIAGYISAHLLSGAVRTIIAYKDAIARKADGDSASERLNRSCDAVSNAAIVAWTDEHPEIHDVIRQACRLKDVVRSVEVPAWIWLVGEHNPQSKIDEFVGNLIAGEGLHRSDPIYTLRNRLIQDRINRKHKVRGEVLAMMTRAWNSWILGKPLSLLRMSDWKLEPIMTFDVRAAKRK
jgi:hypothetical protein